jgi:hypothetical protein
MAKDKNRGGARPGAGRPQSGHVQVKLWLSPKTKAELGEAAITSGMTKSQFAEKAIQKWIRRRKALV